MYTARIDFNIKVLVPVLTQLQKLSVEIKSDKQAIELKEIKTLAHNLQYFELSYALSSETEEHLGQILENLPLGLDNLSIEHVTSYGVINPFMEKIMEKVVNGDTKRVTIASVDDKQIIKKIVEMKPEPVRVEETNPIVIERVQTGPDSRTHFFRYVCDIVISF